MNFNQKAVDALIECITPLPADLSKDNVETILSEKLANFNFNVTFAHGLSKVAILCKEFGGVVLKIPFKGMYLASYRNSGEKIWHRFSEANKENPSDYCFLEYKTYKTLQSLGLQNFVAKTKFYKKKSGWNFYLQEEVIPNDDIEDDSSWYTPSNKSQRLTDRWYCSGKKNIDAFDFDLLWLATCIDYYGSAKVKKFLDYCVNDPDMVNDLHGQNYGYRKNGTPVLLDFSGFND